MKNKVEIFFRDDDVNLLDASLERISEIFLSRKIPLTYAVEPGNVSPEAARFLVELKNNHRDLVDIIQHGWKHLYYDGKAEFSGRRSYQEQSDDIRQGKRRMKDLFGNAFFPAFVFPLHIYEKYSMQILDEFKYQVVSLNYSCNWSRRVFYRFGNLLHRERLWRRHVSHHLQNYPGTALFEISVSCSLESKYINHYDVVNFESRESVSRQILKCSKYAPVVGIMFHHKYYKKTEHFQLIESILDKFLQSPQVTFTTIQSVFEKRREKKTFSW